MHKDWFLWKVMAGKLPPPSAAETFGLSFNAIDSEAGAVEVEFQAIDAFTNPTGKIQGGFSALDDTMGPALAATLGPNQFAPTLNLNVSFERPAVVGPVVGKGRVNQARQRRMLLAAELFQDGKLVASATAIRSTET